MAKKKTRGINHKPRVITDHLNFYWPTIDNWAPNFPRNTVYIRLHDQTTDPNVFIKMSVMGADDTCMAKEFYLTTKEKEATLEECKKFLRNLPNPLTQKWLQEQGFKYD